MSTTDKYNALLTRLESLGRVMVAYSGGVDSTLLAVTAHAVLGGECLAVLATSDTYPESEVVQARALAGHLGLNLMEVETYEMADPRFAENSTDRCYYCKSELWGLLRRVGEARGFEHIADGSNIDDLSDFRPGSRASAEFGVISPLRDAGMTKLDIRHVARELGLPNWNKPSMACLASRIPYGQAITEKSLAQVSAAETSLRALGLSQFRVRAHGDVARLEVADEDMEQAWAMRHEIADAVRDAGFTWVAQDLHGYRTGSMNEVLPSADGVDASAAS